METINISESQGKVLQHQSSLNVKSLMRNDPMSNNIYLYLKTHNKTGLKYLGKTTQNPFKYNGSGVYWQKHLNKHGTDISTKVIYETQDEELFKIIGTYVSEQFDIVNSNEWANLKPESGDGGGGYTHTEEWKQQVSKRHTGRIKSPEECKNISKGKKGKSIKGHEQTKEIREKISKANKGMIRTSEQRANISNSLKGRVLSDEHKANIAIGLQTAVRNNTKSNCIHCGKEVLSRMMNIWHNDNCAHENNPNYKDVITKRKVQKEKEWNTRKNK